MRINNVSCVTLLSHLLFEWKTYQADTVMIICRVLIIHIPFTFENPPFRVCNFAEGLGAKAQD
ncbi:MAG: hypothetical protein DSZ28_08325 [Thiothrix sp.]|nr:MAG: hypothetical protein DSZ28_08325 [Thiothrix sp.]